MRRKICVVTGTRAEYHLLENIIQELTRNSVFTMKLIVTGSHLSSRHGLTKSEIISDGILIDREIPILNDLDTAPAIGLAMARAIEGFSEALNDLRPDLVLLLGDRFEILSAAIAAQLNKIPVGHIHGGEVTEGAMDDAFRHSVTKLSHLHFVAAEVYRKRVLQLGENPEFVFNVGGLGVDLIGRTKKANKKELEIKLGVTFQEKNLLITFHPATLDKNEPEQQFEELLAALLKLNKTTFIFTMPNADLGNIKIRQKIEKFVKGNRNAFSFESLGSENYLSCMSVVDGVIGNSSSGITEAPTLKVGTVNIGSRQSGRLKAASVIDCEPNCESILVAIKKIYAPEFQNSLPSVVNPYGEPGASKRILDILSQVSFEKLLSKKFNDIF